MVLKVGVVGMGNIGNRHAEIYMENPKTELVAVCDIVKEKADNAAEKYNAEVFYDVDTMLNSKIKLDACSMCTAGEENGGDHYQPTMKILKAAIPLLGEKPISNKIEEAEEMVQLAHEKKVPYGVDLNHRFTPAARKAKGWVEDGRLGKLHIINMRMWIDNPTETSPWFHLRALHPHSFDVMRYFCGDIKSVASFMMKGEDREIWSNAQIILYFENDVVGTLTGSYDAGTGYGLERCEVVGSKGRFVLEEACEHLHYYKRKSIESETYNYLGGMRSFNETFAERIGNWIDQIDAGVEYDKIDGSGREALKAQKVIEGAIKSWKTHKIIDLK